MDYKVLLFDIESLQSNQDDEADKEADEIRMGISVESLAAKPLLKQDFINRVDSAINNRALAEKIALGCQ